MPFTFSHPAAMIPFRILPKKWTSLTGLVIGSMCPDFEYFIRMKGYSTFGHSWGAMFWFVLPLSIVLSFLYHYIVRDTLIDNLPAFLKNRLLQIRNFDWINYLKKNYWVVVISILIGGCTHVLWDGLTHKHGLFVKKNGWFDQAFIIDGYIMTRYKMLQHVSTIIGGIVVILALFSLPPEKIIANQKSILPYWSSVGLITVAITSIRMLFMSAHDMENFNHLIVTIIAGFLIGLLITPKLLILKARS
jgi:hypothetical protein